MGQMSRFLALALVIATARDAETPDLVDKEPPAAALQGPASGRLARDVTIRFADAYSFEPVPLTPQNGGKATSATPQPHASLAAYTLSIARRHFEEAAWGTDKTAGKGREVVISRIAVLVQQGPHYQVNVDVDRRENGRRKGSATGQGHAAPDRSSDRMAAAFAPGFLGAAAAHDANTPKARKDAAAIEVATLRALDSAMLQLAAYWAGEQLADEYREKALEPHKSRKK